MTTPIIRVRPSKLSARYGRTDVPFVFTKALLSIDEVHQSASCPPSLIEVPDYRQPNHFSCSAYATASVAHYFGVGPKEPSEFEQKLGTTEQQGTSPKRVIEYLTELGLQVEAKQNMTLEDLKASWLKGHPVICPVQDYRNELSAKASFAYGHTLTFIGGPAMGYLFFQDSSEDNVIDDSGSIQKPGRIMIAVDDFLKLWHDRDGAGNDYVRYGISVGPPIQQSGEKGLDHKTKKEDTGWRTIEHTHVHFDKPSGGEIDKGPPQLIGKKPSQLPKRKPSKLKPVPPKAKLRTPVPVNRPGKPQQATAPVQPKPAPKFPPRKIPTASPAVQEDMEYHRQTIDKHTNLTSEQKKLYGDALERVFRSMPAKAFKRASSGATSFEYHPDSKGVTEAFEKKTNRKLASNQTVGGFYTASSGKLVLDGYVDTRGTGTADDISDTQANIHGVYAHELTHALDWGGGKGGGALSSSPDWQHAFKEEIESLHESGQYKLGKYAASSAVEGFAEFGRLLYGSDIPPEMINKKFPKCTAFFWERGLWE